MNYLYILSEDDNDDAFYKKCIEKITGKSFELFSFLFRRGGGIAKVRSNMSHLLNHIKRTDSVENTYFVIALDNDRSPVHPDHEKIPGFQKLSKKEQKQTCRFCEIEQKIFEILGDDRQKWAIPGAIAIPVQMIESWLLLICDSEQYKNEKSLPLFAKKESPPAQRYYGKKTGNQLKDLCKIQKEKLDIDSSKEFCSHCAENLVPEELKKISPSFALFEEQVSKWD